jgi:hypothetical protein
MTKLTVARTGAGQLTVTTAIRMIPEYPQSNRAGTVNANAVTISFISVKSNVALK